MGGMNSCCRDRKLVEKHTRYNMTHRADEYLRGKLEKGNHKKKANRLYCVGTGCAALGGAISIIATGGLAAIVSIPPTVVSAVECVAAHDRAECAKIKTEVISSILENRERRRVLYLDTYSNIKIQPTEVYTDFHGEYNENDALVVNMV